MANLKNITDLPVAESAEGLNLIVNDNGAAKQIAAGAVGTKNYNDLENKPCYTEVDESGNETVHKLDAKYLPEWDAKIELDGGNTIDSVNEFILTEGSYSKVVEKIKNKEVPKISIFWLYDYTGWMMEITSTPYMTIMNEDLISNAVEIHFRGMHTTDFVIYLKSDNTVVGTSGS